MPHSDLEIGRLSRYLQDYLQAWNVTFRKLRRLSIFLEDNNVSGDHADSVNYTCRLVKELTSGMTRAVGETNAALLSEGCSEVLIGPLQLGEVTKINRSGVAALINALVTESKELGNKHVVTMTQFNNFGSDSMYSPVITQLDAMEPSAIFRLAKFESSSFESDLKELRSVLFAVPATEREAQSRERLGQILGR